MSEQRAITRAMAVKWRDGWTTADIKLIEHHIDRLGIDSLHDIQGQGCIRCRRNDSGLKTVMEIRPGYLKVPKEDGSGDWEWPGLSTFSPYEGSPNGESESQECPTCYMELPLTGICDWCDD